MQVGQRVQLKFLHKPIGTITSVIDGFTMNGVTLIGLSYSVQWGDGSVGESVRGNELEAIDNVTLLPVVQPLPSIALHSSFLTPMFQ